MSKLQFPKNWEVRHLDIRAIGFEPRLKEIALLAHRRDQVVLANECQADLLNQYRNKLGFQRLEQIVIRPGANPGPKNVIDTYASPTLDLGFGFGSSDRQLNDSVAIRIERSFEIQAQKVIPAHLTDEVRSPSTNEPT